MFRTNSALLFVVLGVAYSTGHLFKRQAESTGTIEEEDPQCECVPYYLCEENKIITNGGGILDPRIKTCTGYDVCCGLPEDEKTTKPPAPEPPEEPLDNKGDGDKGDGGFGSENFIYGMPKVTPGEGCGRRRTPGKSKLGDDFLRITGPEGVPEETFYGEVPWMARIHTTEPEPDQTEFVCGGTLLTPSIVVTAAHCIADFEKEKLIVRLGEWNTNGSNEAVTHQDMKVEKIMLHPHYNARSLSNDIALIFLETDVKLSEAVDVICLPDKKEHINVTHCVAVGWGLNFYDDSGKYPAILRKVVLPLIGRAECQKKMRLTKLGKHFRLQPGFICAGGRPESDTCKGDGGGPLICPLLSNPNKLTLIGVISWGVDCGKGNPAVFSSVEHFLPWLLSNLV